MLKLVSNKDGVEIHTLQIENGVATIEPAFEGIQELLQGLTDKQQILSALSGFNPDYVWAVTYAEAAARSQSDSEYCLSVVNISPDSHKDVINKIAELYGCGPTNLSVKLQDGTGNIYWGCHSWWNVDDYAEFTDADKRAEMFAEYPAEQQALFNAALESLYERAVLDGVASENRDAAYAELGLSVVNQNE